MWSLNGFLLQPKPQEKALTLTLLPFAPAAIWFKLRWKVDPRHLIKSMNIKMTQHIHTWLPLVESISTASFFLALSRPNTVHGRKRKTDLSFPKTFAALITSSCVLPKHSCWLCPLCKWQVLFLSSWPLPLSKEQMEESGWSCLWGEGMRRKAQANKRKRWKQEEQESCSTALAGFSFRILLTPNEISTTSNDLALGDQAGLTTR